MNEDVGNIIHASGKSGLLQCGIKIKLGVSGSKFLYVEMSDMVYFKANGRNSKLIRSTIDNEIKLSRSLGDWERFLGNYSFVRAGRTYLINMKYLQEIDIVKRTCTLNTGLKNITLSNLSDTAIKALTKNEYFVT